VKVRGAAAAGATPAMRKRVSAKFDFHMVDKRFLVDEPRRIAPKHCEVRIFTVDSLMIKSYGMAWRVPDAL
jgi:hypothetical protein